VLARVALVLGATREGAQLTLIVRMRSSSTTGNELPQNEGFRLGLRNMLRKPSVSITVAEKTPLGTRKDGGGFGMILGFSLGLVLGWPPIPSFSSSGGTQLVTLHH
jgi:hypothetical protein